jgi:hypothetical protein
MVDAYTVDAWCSSPMVVVLCKATVTVGGSKANGLIGVEAPVCANIQAVDFSGLPCA